MLTTKNSIASIMAAKHPARNSNALDAGTVSNQEVDVYTGDYRVLDNCATPVPRVLIAGVWTYKPTTLDQVVELEYQVTQGRVTKTTLS